LHTCAKLTIRLGTLWYKHAIQEVEKHFVHDLGARPRHEVDQRDYEEGGGRDDTIMDLQNFGEYVDWSGSGVGEQLDGIDFRLSEDT
jgi:hypothetical protein